MNPDARALAQRCLLLGFCAAFLAVLIGAFGAHGLASKLQLNGRLDTFATASEYHFYHALGLIAVGLLALQGYSRKWLRWAGNLMLIGMLVFSGSLYILSISNWTFMGMIAPLGGSLLLLAWGSCIMAIIRNDRCADVDSVL